MTHLSGRTAVVTGGTSGIGAAIAHRLAAAGARVVLSGRDAERGAAVVQAISDAGGEALFVAADITRDADVAELARVAASEGPLDFWFSNAGTEGPIGPMENWTPEALREVVDANLTSVLSGLHHASTHMRRGGVIVNTASFVGTVLPVPIAVPYAAAKAGVVAAGRSAAPLLAEAGIDVFTLCPWVIDTPMVDRLTGGAPDDKAGFAAGFAPSGRLTPVDDVARAAVDLVTAQPRRASGEAILVDAGPTVTVLD
ncbi:MULTISPECIES: SDR family oxidoreductase [Microbacterium]|jgi:NAD(P)-dependent dehydrogenase (short-subunit alcohol dehydrogenase family)|uniref:SDR family NAD(P)-dependent oxidoreductase n=1 Tax=Microbacterium TaxID=33882 RepID=UPI0023DA92E7|nr:MULTISPECIES: SDR family oxidoreductase [Microbacterium]MDF2047881.1 SDR family oxidoreductase [Microbacterium sp. Kw_RZR3]MDF2919797.1 fabG 12 [Microbacterium sp.]MDQ1114832.1 NAD(P)-dependent dehydrogenase (short-subunit alcohol dehydrogenase family) [Microbacterium testaceum]